MGKEADEILMIIDNLYELKVTCQCGELFNFQSHHHLRDGQAVVALCKECDHQVILRKQP